MSNTAIPKETLKAVCQRHTHSGSKAFNAAQMYCGWLERRTKVLKRWKRKYFVMTTAGCLFELDSEVSKDRFAEISLPPDRSLREKTLISALLDLGIKEAWLLGRAPFSHRRQKPLAFYLQTSVTSAEVLECKVATEADLHGWHAACDRLDTLAGDRVEDHTYDTYTPTALEDEQDRVRASMMCDNTVFEGGLLYQRGRALLDRGEEAQPHLHGDWNTRYQAALELPEETAVQVLHKYSLLTQLSSDFVVLASLYGRIIINELCLRPQQRTIQSRALGGVAGGKKYIVQGMVFKVARDVLLPSQKYLYSAGPRPNDEFAAKSCGNELRSAIQCYSYATTYLDSVIRVPMQVTVDYRGFRLIVMPYLPISDDSLVYGSKDAGVTVINADSDFDAAATELAQAIHLKSHPVGKSSSLSFGGDVEGHRGTDGRFYLLDLARVLPPEDPQAFTKLNQLTRTGRGVFFRLLRPELLVILKERYNHEALSSDAFSRWGQCPFTTSPGHENQECRHCLTFEADMQSLIKATSILTDQLIPEYAKWLASQTEPVNVSVESHKRGINIRWLGRVRSFIPASPDTELARETLLISMVQRTLKNHLRALLRYQSQHTKDSGSAGEFEMKEAVVAFLNQMTYVHCDSSDQFWTHTLNGLRARFGEVALAEEEDVASVYATVKGHLVSVVEYCLSRVGLGLSRTCITDANNTFHHFVFTSADVIDAPVRVKHMVQLEQGRLFSKRALKSLKEASGHNNALLTAAAARLLALSSAKFADALIAQPTSLQAMYESALAQYESYCLTTSTEKAAVVADGTLLQTLERYMGVPYPSLVKQVVIPLLGRLFREWQLRLSLGRHEAKVHCGGAASADVLLTTRHIMHTCETVIEKKSAELKDLQAELNQAFACRHASVLVLWAHFRRSQHEMLVRTARENVDDMVYGDMRHRLSRQFEQNADVQESLWHSYMLFASEGRYELIGLLEELGIESNAADNSGLLPVMRFVKAGKLNIVKDLLRSTQHVHYKDRNGDTPLSMCIKSNQTKDMLETIIEAKADINTVNVQGLTPLMLAAEEGRKDLVNALLEHKADATVATPGRSETALMIACQHAAVDTVSALLPVSNVGHRDRKKRTATLRAASVSTFSPVQRDVLTLLLSQGSLYDATEHGQTALHLAVSSRQPEMTQVVLKANANTDDPSRLLEAQDNEQRTALRLAVELGAVDLVDALIQAKANPDARGMNGDSPVAWALKNKQWPVYGHLVHHCDPNLLDGDKEVPLLLLCSLEDDVRAADTLVRAAVSRIDVNAKSPRYNHWSVLHHAAYYNRVKLAYLLMDRLGESVDINLPDDWNRTMVNLACEQGHYEIARLAVKHGADVTIMARHNGNALHKAALGKSVPCMALALYHGADPTVLDSEGMPARFYCRNQDLPDWLREMLSTEGGLSEAKRQQLRSYLDEHDASITFPSEHDFLLAEEVQPPPSQEIHEGAGEETAVKWLVHQPTLPVELLASLLRRLPLADAFLEPSDDRGRQDAEAIDADTTHIIGDLLPRECKDIYTHTPLLAAVSRGNVEAVRCLVEAKADINVQRKGTNQTPLMVAIGQGFVSIVDLLLASKADPTIKDLHGSVSLCQAVAVRPHSVRRELVRTLLRHKADPNMRDGKGRPALFAVSDVDIAKLLVSAKADPLARANDDATVLFHATDHSGSNVSLVQYFLDLKVDPNAPSKAQFRHPLCLMALNNKQEAIRAMLAAKSDVNPSMADGLSVLHMIATRPAQELLSQLLEAKADPNVKTDSGHTPLFQAARAGSHDVCAALIEAKADVNAVSNDGTSMLLPALGRSHQAVVDLFVKHGYKPPSLFEAIYMKDLTQFEALLADDSVDPNFKLAPHSMTPMLILCDIVWKKEELPVRRTMAQLLLDRKVDLSARDNKDFATALVKLTASGNDLKLIRMLLDAGADLDAKDRKQNTGRSLLTRLLARHEEKPVAALADDVAALKSFL